MPDVPQLPGVPDLTSFATTLPVLLLSDLLALFGIEVWGVFFGFIPVLSYDNLVSFEYKQDWRISNYPVELGSFQSYDKVQMPSEIRIRLSTGGSTLKRQAMLAVIDLQMSNTSLYNIVTPEAVYLNYNFERRDYDREAERAGLVVIDLWFIEVLQTATAQFQTTANPANTGQVSSGTVGATPTTPATQSSVTSSMTGGN